MFHIQRNEEFWKDNIPYAMKSCEPTLRKQNTPLHFYTLLKGGKHSGYS
jgi:hypothetical protein